MPGLDHEAVERMPIFAPAALGGHHVEGQHAVRQVAGMGQRHLAAGAQQVGKPQAAVDAHQPRAARADDQQAGLAGHGSQVAGLHQHRPYQRVGAGADGQPGDLGAGLGGQCRRQGQAGLDRQRLAGVALQARGADQRPAGLVAADQHHGAVQPVGRVGLGQRLRQPRQVAAVGLRPQRAGFAQFGAVAGDADRERQLGRGHRWCSRPGGATG